MRKPTLWIWGMSLLMLASCAPRKRKQAPALPTGSPPNPLEAKSLEGPPPAAFIETEGESRIRVEKEHKTRRSAQPPQNDRVTGKVPQVESYLRTKLRKPESIVFHEWGPVHEHGKGWAVKCRYSSAGSSLGRTRSSMLFLMRKDGRVYRQVPLREGK